MVFLRPLLERSGTLNTYIDSHLYLDFARKPEAGLGTGFWVKP